MPFVMLGLLFALLVFAPQWWARRTFKRHAEPLDRIPGTGAELARHLLDRMGMKDVKVEATKPGGDHYDPMTRTVRLSPDNHDQRSLTAVAVAAHEVGHAIQHHTNDPRLALRTRMVTLAQSAQQLGAAAMVVLPFAVAITRAPGLGVLMFLIGLASMGMATVVHFITLPVEVDASFNKALPILREGGYIAAEDETAVRSILRAAAYTYVAASLASLLNIGRWIAMLRRA
ncbi:MAG: zinc metallopeptidase [Thiotrichales bacterium]